MWINSLKIINVYAKRNWVLIIYYECCKIIIYSSKLKIRGR